MPPFWKNQYAYSLQCCVPSLISSARPILTDITHEFSTVFHLSPSLSSRLCCCCARLSHADSISPRTRPHRPAVCAQSAQLIKNKPDWEQREDQQCAAARRRTASLLPGCCSASVSCSRGMCMLLCLITTQEKDKYRNGSPRSS